MDPEDAVQPSRQPAGSAAPTVCEVTTAISNGSSVLFAMEALKADLLRTIRSEMSKGFEQQSATLSKKITEECEKSAEKTTSEVYFYLSTCAGTKSIVQNSKSKTPPLALEKYSQISSRKQVIVPFLQWVTLATVASFIYTYDGLRSWLPERVYTKTLAHSISTIYGASGLSAILSAVKSSGRGEERKKCPVWRLSSYVMRNAIVTVLRNGLVMFENAPADCSPPAGSTNISSVTTAGSKQFQPASRTAKMNSAPPWLSSFGRKGATISAVNSAMDRLDRIEKREPVSKKRKMVEESEVGAERGSSGDIEADRLRQCRYEACSLLRGTYSDILNRGRTDVRAHLFEEFLFLTEHISKFENVEAAKEAGFYITADNPSELESSIPAAEHLLSSIWDIENAKTVGGKLSDASVHGHNNDIMKKMQTHFPSLWLTLHWKRKVLAPIPPNPEYSEDLFWSMKKRVSLHRVAVGVLLEIVKAGCPDVVLSSSPYSTKAVHVIAIGLRGLLSRCMLKTPSALELSALGDVGGNEDEGGNHAVNAMIDTTPKKNLKSASRVEKIIAKQFQMSWSEFKIEDERKKQERQRRIAVAIPSPRESVDDSEEDRDLFENN